jgi:hypothetical protein
MAIEYVVYFLKTLDFSSFNFSISHTLWLNIYRLPQMKKKNPKKGWR